MENPKKQKRKNKYAWLWLLALILFVCVAATTAAIVSLMGDYMPDDRGAISLIPEDKGEDDTSSDVTPTPPDNTEEPEKDETPKPNPGFKAADDKKEWSTQTEVELFYISYSEDEEGTVTVESVDGTQVIAPGTNNTYVFKLKNTGNVALDYQVDMEAFCTPADILIPVNGRVCRYDGEWVIGGADEYPILAEQEDARDVSTLGAGCYAYYTLDWVWPYEGLSDEMDTMLGNLSSEQELTFTIRISTYATESADPNAEGGIRLPQTGDNTNLVMLFALAISSFVMMVVLIVWFIIDRRKNSEEKKS